MELQKKKRKTLRAQVSRLIGEAEKLLPLPMPSVEELEVLIERLLLVEAQLKDVNAAIEPLLADEDAEDEFTHAIEYSDKIPTSECYDDAIDILQQRFGNQAALIQDHIDSLMNLTPVSSPRNVRALRRMYDNVQAHLRGLKALGVGEESYCAMLYLGLLRALPSDLSLDYNRKVTSRNAEEVSSAGTSSSDTSSETSKKPVHLGMLSDLLNFLRIEVETLEKSIIERPDGTAWVESGRQMKLARLMFDSGSQRTFITEKLSRELNCKLLGTEILAVGVFGGESKERTFRRVLVTLRSRLNDKKIEIDALETPKICEHDLPSPDESILIKLDEIGLSVGDDLSGQSDRDVDLLLGSDHYWTAMTGRIHRLTESLTAVESVFGWAVQGRTGSRTSRMNCSQAIVLKATAPDLESSSLLRSFWELESVGVTDALDDDPPGKHVRRNFEASITQSNGRYEVALPWKADVRLADNKQVALNRMENVRKKLSKNKGLLEEYDQAIRFYQNSGIAERADVLEIATEPSAELLDISRFSSASKVNRTTAWIFRFLHNLKSTEKRSGPLTATEIQAARTHWLRKAQQSAFSADLKCVTEGTKSPRDSPLRDFITFIDDEGVLRIKSRFHSANMTYDERSPVVLPKQHRYSTLLTIDAHRQVLHAGVRDTVVQLREKYWILRGRELVKKVCTGLTTEPIQSANTASILKDMDLKWC
ncbi:uncharacterized protein LOC144161808 [Haemaphysalis longicornis]